MSYHSDKVVMMLATFSIVARGDRDGEFGVASATAAPCVGALLPFASANRGAIATQAWVNVNLGHHGLGIMRSGLSVGTALESLLREDLGREKRQVIGIDRRSVFGFTGAECTAEKSHILGKDFAVAGNMLANESVLGTMAESFRSSKGELGGRLIEALEAGQGAGGDRRGKVSAVLLVSSTRPKLWHDLRVDMHKSPVEELRRLYEAAVVMQEELGDDDDGEVLWVLSDDD